MGKADTGQEASEASTAQVHRGIDDGMLARGVPWQHGKSHPVERSDLEPAVREEGAGPDGMAERSV
jgi:hypothetical protein